MTYISFDNTWVVFNAQVETILNANGCVKISINGKDASVVETIDGVELNVNALSCVVDEINNCFNNPRVGVQNGKELDKIVRGYAAVQKR